MTDCTVNIFDMKIEDLDLIANNLNSDFDDFWTYNVFKSELENGNSKYLVAKFDDQIVGFAGLIPVLDEADISNIVVHKDFRNMQIGSVLLEQLLILASSLDIKVVNLEVCESNAPAIHLYKKFGFEACGLRKNYYGNSENAILMRKFL